MNQVSGKKDEEDWKLTGVDGATFGFAKVNKISDALWEIKQQTRWVVPISGFQQRPDDRVFDPSGLNKSDVI